MRLKLGIAFSDSIIEILGTIFSLFVDEHLWDVAVKTEVIDHSNSGGVIVNLLEEDGAVDHGSSDSSLADSSLISMGGAVEDDQVRVPSEFLGNSSLDQEFTVGHEHGGLLKLKTGRGHISYVHGPESVVCTFRLVSIKGLIIQEQLIPLTSDRGVVDEFEESIDRDLNNTF